METRLATALLALICLLKMAVLLTSSTVIALASLEKSYWAWEVEMILGAGLGIRGAPVGAV